MTSKFTLVAIIMPKAWALYSRGQHLGPVDAQTESFQMIATK